MDRGPRVPDNVRLLIARIYLEMRKKNPKIKAPAVREAVRCRLKKVPYPGWPGLSVVQKVITDIRKRDADPLFNRQDEPWCLACLDEYPLSPEVLKAVCEVWAADLKELIDSAATAEAEGLDIIDSRQLGNRLSTNPTIREVKWIARLHCIIQEDTAIRPWGSPNRLSTTAELYARAERLHEMLGIPFESDEMDRHLILGIPKLIKVDRVSLGFLILSLDKERGLDLEAVPISSKIPVTLDSLLIDGKVPEWLIPLISFGGTVEALRIMRQQNVKKPGQIKAKKKGGKK